MTASGDKTIRIWDARGDMKTSISLSLCSFGKLQCALGYCENSGLSNNFLGMFKHDFHSVSLHTGVAISINIVMQGTCDELISRIELK